MINLEETTIKDLDFIISIEKDNSAFVFPNTFEEHLDQLENEDIKYLSLRTENNKLVGFVILAGLKNANRSIEFRRIVISEKSKGYGRKALQLVKTYCFEQLNAHRLWLDVLESNTRARKLYCSEGFVEEGVLRDSILVSGDYENLVLMSILKADFIRH